MLTLKSNYCSALDGKLNVQLPDGIKSIVAFVYVYIFQNGFYQSCHSTPNVLQTLLLFCLHILFRSDVLLTGFRQM